MYFIDEFQKGDDTFNVCVMVSEVNLDEVDDNKVQLLLKPYDEDIKLVKHWYHRKNDEYEGSQTIDYFRLNLFYDKEHDRIEIVIKSNLDKFVYNICKLLSIGRITLYYKSIDELEEKEDNYLFSVSENHIRSVILTLEEFKRLDGFCGLIDVRGLSVVHFKGLFMPLKSLRESVCNDFERLDGNEEYLLRGEKLFKLD